MARKFYPLMTPEIAETYLEYRKHRDHVREVEAQLKAGITAENKHLVSHHGPACDRRDKALANLGMAVAASMDQQMEGHEEPQEQIVCTCPGGNPSLGNIGCHVHD